MSKTFPGLLATQKTWRNEQNGIYTQDANSNWTIEQFANYWFDNYVVGKVKNTTESDDRSILDAHIIKGIGQYKLKNITGQTLNRFYNECAKKLNPKGEKISPKTVKNIYSVANRMFKCAYRNDIIPNNPNEKAVLPKRNKTFVTTLLPEEAEKLAQSCIKSGTTMDYLIVFLLCTGVRLGEALGLQWCKVNFIKEEIRIDQQLQSIRDTDKNAKRKFKKVVHPSTKTKYSNRTLPMLEGIIRLLNVVKHRQAPRKLKLGADYRKDLDLVFAKNDGYFICDTVLRKYFNDKLEELNIPHYRIHDLRHSYATRLFESGKYDAKTVSQILGHSCIGTTLDTYTHVMPEKLKNEIKKSSIIFKRYFNNTEKEIPDEMVPQQDDWGA